MRKKIVAGNWKMNLNLQEGVALATELNAALAADKPNCDVVICTPCAVCHFGTFGASRLLRRDCRNPEREGKLGFGKRSESYLLYR